jgi:hypothetical protein
MFINKIKKTLVKHFLPEKRCERIRLNKFLLIKILPVTKKIKY